MGKAFSPARLFGLARPQLPLLSAATLALLVSTGLSLVFPLAIRLMIDAITQTDASAQMDEMTWVLLALFFVSAIASGLRAWLFTLAGERIVAKLRTDLFQSVIGQETGFFDATRTGELTNRLSNDTAVLQNAVTVNISMALRFGLGALGGMVMLAWMSPRLTLLTLLIVPVVIAFAAVFGRWIRKRSKAVQDALAHAGEVAEEAISGLRTVRSFDAEPMEVARYGAAIDQGYRLSASVAAAYGGFQAMMGFAGYTGLVIIVWYGGRLVLAGEMSLGDLTAYLLYTLTVAMSLGALSGLYGDFMRAVGASERVFELLDRARGIEAQVGETLASVRGEISFESVTFAYPTRPDVPVLHELSIAIRPGEILAFVGPSGAGKSTLTSLLLRFYDPVSGQILIDGHRLQTLDPHAWRRHVGIVSQEPILFATSVRDNVRYAKPEASHEAVREALEIANALSFVEAFPEGLDTMVGERGVRLSGGQKQRIAIARAVLADPAILLLDEATSALDAENEALVQEALERLMAGRTTLIIAHRLSTVRRADRLVVLDGGRVIEEGGHDALMAKHGVYRQLVERQLA